MGARGALYDAMQPDKRSNGWAQRLANRAEKWKNLDPEQTSQRFRAIANKTNCPFDNTVGDLSGCPVDAMHVKSKHMLICRLERLVGPVISGNPFNAPYHCEIGGTSKKSLTGMFIIAWATERETLRSAWSAITSARLARERSRCGYPIVDEHLRREWHPLQGYNEALSDRSTLLHQRFPCWKSSRA